MEQFKISDIQDLFAADLERFVAQTRTHVTYLVNEPTPPQDSLDEALRQAHTLKGLAATVRAWGLSCWGADLERLLELSQTFLATDRKSADAIFNFILEQLDNWEVMNQFSLADLLPQAWDHYLGLRQLMEDQWKDYLPPLYDPEAHLPAADVGGFSAAPARPQPLELEPPPLLRIADKPDETVEPVLDQTVPDSELEPARPAPLNLVPPTLRHRTEEPAMPAASVEIQAGEKTSATDAAPPILRVAPPTLKRKTKQATSAVPASPVAPIGPVPEPVLVAQPAPEVVPTIQVAAKEEFNPKADGDFLDMLGEEVATYLNELAETLILLAGNLADEACWEKTRRIFHTIKGTAATFHLDAVSAPAKAAEARCIVAVEDATARSCETFESCLARAKAVATALRLPFDDAAVVAALENAQALAQINAAAVVTGNETPIDPEMAGFFVRDAGDQVQAIEQAVLLWEKGEEPSEQVWAAQRAFHTIKGAANSIGLTAVAQSVHEVEAFLEGVAAAGANGSKALFTLLLGGVDQLRNFLRDLAENPAASWRHNWNDLLAAVLQPSSTPTTDGAVSTAAAPVAAPDDSADDVKTLRIEADRLYKLMNLIGEMVVDRARLEKKIEQIHSLHRALAERNGALTSSVQDFQKQFEFNLLQNNDRNPTGGRGIRPATGDPVAPGLRTHGEFSELEFDRYDQFSILARSLVEISHDVEQLNGDMDSCLESFNADNARFSQTSQQLQSQVTNLSLVPVNTLFPRLQRAFRDALRVEEKDADLVLNGGDALLDKVVVDKIYAPLLHLLRNAVAHGIEDSVTREVAKKPSRGTVLFAAAQVSNQIVIQITDDGAGVRADAVRQRAIAKGWLAADAPALTNDQVIHFIFQPGFSTAAKVTSVSGRGIGLDVVRKDIENLNGSVELKFVEGQGSTWTLRLPLTLSISEAILAQAGGGMTFAFPINFVEAGIILDAPVTKDENGRESFTVGSGSLPIVRLSEVLQLPGIPGTTNGIIVSVGDRRAIVVVDRVLARQEIVNKQLDSLTSRHPLLNGATLDAEGRVIPVLNLPMLLKFSERATLASSLRPPSNADAVATTDELRVLIVDDSLSVRKVQERFLTDLGCKVVAAVDGLNALEKLREEKFDLVFTDLEMPRLNGYELISELRGNPAWSALPVMVISSRGADKYITKAMNLGATTFLSKPFTAEQLEQVLRHYGNWDATARARLETALPV